MDMKTAFLHGAAEEEIYMEQPEGFEQFSKDTHVCKLKQAPRACYTRIDNYLQGLGFTKSEVDANLYYIMVRGLLLIPVLYVDYLYIEWSRQLDPRLQGEPCKGV